MTWRFYLISPGLNGRIAAVREGFRSGSRSTSGETERRQCCLSSTAATACRSPGTARARKTPNRAAFSSRALPALFARVRPAEFSPALEIGKPSRHRDGFFLFELKAFAPPAQISHRYACRNSIAQKRESRPVPKNRAACQIHAWPFRDTHGRKSRLRYAIPDPDPAVGVPRRETYLTRTLLPESY